MEKRNNNNTINVAFCINDGYVGPLLITLFSLLSNNKKHTFNIYVVSTDITPENKSNLRKVCENIGNATLFFVEPDASIFKSFKLNIDYISVETYYRFVLADVIYGCDKILYLDADILVVGDLGDLWRTNLDSYWAAGVRDRWVESIKKVDGSGKDISYKETIGIQGNALYINAGAMLLNLKNIRRDRKSAQLLKNTELYSDKIEFQDQDIINITFNGGMLELDSEYNYMNHDRKLHPCRVDELRIVHYNGPTKPWQKDKPVSRYHAIYFDEYAKYEGKYAVSSGQYKVSIVVPAYNVEKYLHACIDSILKQTYQNLEVIIVDDKTPDRSGVIADEYANKDQRIKVIHKSKNEGLNMARATGFKASTGAYVMFVDSDDIIAQDSVEFSLMALVKNGADFVKFNLLTFSDNETLPVGLGSVDETGQEMVAIGKRDLYESRLNNSMVGVSRVTVWGGLYSRDAVKKIDWKKSNYRQHEDVYWTMQLIDNVNKGVYLSRIGYFYRINEFNDNALSKQLAGNSLNEVPVGALEFIDDYQKNLEHLNKKHNLGLDKEIDKFVTWQWVDQLSKLSKANMLASENNLEYLPKAISRVIEKYQESKDQLSKEKQRVLRHRENIDSLRAEKGELERKINLLHDENRKLKNDIRSFHTIKRSARLLLGNLKRKMESIVK